jgi:GxxExxY protein
VDFELNDLTSAVIDECIRIHKELGPGLLESVYETVLAGALARRGFESRPANAGRYTI